jgi:Polysaccharide lyase
VWVLFTQWHQKDPNGTNPAIGSSPPIEFIIEKGMLKLRLNRASQPGPSTEFTTVDLAQVSPGMWHHWAAEIQWSPTDGSVKVWHDGTCESNPHGRAWPVSSYEGVRNRHRPQPRNHTTT